MAEVRTQTNTEKETITLVEMQNICKSFPGIKANDNVNLKLNAGEVHVLLGENGAGKSTLMSVLSGLYKPESGKILIGGNEVSFNSPRDAITNGIGMVHQHFKLVQAFTVAENVVLGAKKEILLDSAATLKEVDKFAKDYHLDVDVSAKIWQLSIGEQQRVEILKALYRKAETLVLDEPTAVLTPQEVEILFKTLRTMAERGKAIVVITHKMSEVMALADRVTILRKGKTVATFERSQLDPIVLSEAMIGSKTNAIVPEENTFGKEILYIRDVNALNDRGARALKDVNFCLHEREILGIAGVAGNGQKEILEVIAGLRHIISGEISVVQDASEIKIHNRTVKANINSGIAFIPEDRLGMGLVGNMDLVENMILRGEKNSRWVKYKESSESSKSAVQKYEISVANIGSPLRLLSGGNLQKVLLARELAYTPKVLLVAYPVRGLDVAATNKVYQLLLNQRDRGCAILMVSEDLDSLIAYSDRIMVFCDGKVSGIVPKKNATPARLGLMMTGEPPKEEWLV